MQNYPVNYANTKTNTAVNQTITTEEGNIGATFNIGVPTASQGNGAA